MDGQNNGQRWQVDEQEESSIPHNFNAGGTIMKFETILSQFNWCFDLWLCKMKILPLSALQKLKRL